MKAPIIIFFVCALSQIVIHAQEKEQEIKFFKERTKISKLRIIEIEEWEDFHACSANNSKLKFKYKFDTYGNLVLQSEYEQNILRRTISYTRNDQGNYTSKLYTLFSDEGKPTSTEPWLFEFDSLGQRTKETWLKDGKPFRVNILSYDEAGNLIEQFIDSSFKRVLSYDGAGKVINNETWWMRNDTLKCTSKIINQYSNGYLIKDTGFAPLENRIWRESTYQYDDHGNLYEHSLMYWTKYAENPRELEGTLSRFVYLYDENSNIIREELYLNNGSEPDRCYFYKYVYD